MNDAQAKVVTGLAGHYLNEPRTTVSADAIPAGSYLVVVNGPRGTRRIEVLTPDTSGLYIWDFGEGV